MRQKCHEIIDENDSTIVETASLLMTLVVDYCLDLENGGDVAPHVICKELFDTCIGNLNMLRPQHVPKIFIDPTLN